MSQNSHSVNPDFDESESGHGFPFEMRESSKGVKGELALWCAVVENALREPKGEVRKWLASTNFKFIVQDILSIDAEYAKEIIEKRLSIGAPIIGDLRMRATDSRIVG